MSANDLPDYLVKLFDRSTHRRCEDQLCQLWESHGHDQTHCVACWEDWPCPEAGKPAKEED